MPGITIMSKHHKLYLDIANRYAADKSGCTKVTVGAVIVKNYGKANENVIAMGANRAIPDLCLARGCQRIELYGNAAKEHRLPSDCRAIHSEVDAISKASESVEGCDIFVTRYPCEACARTIVAAGIKRVWFGRTQPISDQTADIFERAGVEVHWLKDWEEADRND